MKCLIYNINNFCGKTMTLKGGGAVTQEIKNSILEYINGEDFQLVALQEFPINHEVGKDFIDKMNSIGFKGFHNNDIVNYQSKGTSISIIFVLGEENHIIRKAFENSLRYVCINVNGIDILNVHASLNVNSFNLHAIQKYAHSHIGFIFGDFNAGKSSLLNTMMGIIPISRKKTKYFSFMPTFRSFDIISIILA